MKKLFWVAVILFILITPLFIYDMYTNKKINLTFFAAIIALIVIYNRVFKS